jgi:hypothetical protein
MNTQDSLRLCSGPGSSARSSYINPEFCFTGVGRVLVESGVQEA